MTQIPADGELAIDEAVGLTETAWIQIDSVAVNVERQRQVRGAAAAGCGRTCGGAPPGQPTDSEAIATAATLTPPAPQ